MPFTTSPRVGIDVSTKGVKSLIVQSALDAGFPEQLGLRRRTVAMTKRPQHAEARHGTERLPVGDGSGFAGL